MPYGNDYYQLAVAVSNVADMATCLALLKWSVADDNNCLRKLGHNRGAGLICIPLLFICAYLLTTAVQSPTPFLVGTRVGGILVVSKPSFHKCSLPFLIISSSLLWVMKSKK